MNVLLATRICAIFLILMVSYFNPGSPDSVVVVDPLHFDKVYFTSLDREDFEEQPWFELGGLNLLSKDRRTLLSYGSGDAYNHAISIGNLYYGYGYSCINDSIKDYAFNTFYQSTFNINSIQLLVTSEVKKFSKIPENSELPSIWHLIQFGKLNNFLSIKKTEGNKIKYFNLVKFQQYIDNYNNNQYNELELKINNINYIVSINFHFIYRDKNVFLARLHKTKECFDFIEEAKYIESIVRGIEVHL